MAITEQRVQDLAMVELSPITNAEYEETKVMMIAITMIRNSITLPVKLAGMRAPSVFSLESSYATKPTP